mmetsp:Transcript_37622/g.79322  ORF Transcript_37622/g.79322 Transcript_37622/m.79322 type:complete len:236 (-) Transcript_37622:1379-2086(-)
MTHSSKYPQTLSNTSGGLTHSGTSSLKSAALLRNRFTAVFRSVHSRGCKPPGSGISNSCMSPSRSLRRSSSSGHMDRQIPMRDLAWLRVRTSRSSTSSAAAALLLSLSPPGTGVVRPLGRGEELLPLPSLWLLLPCPFKSLGSNLCSVKSRSAALPNRNAFFAASSALEAASSSFLLSGGCCCCCGSRFFFGLLVKEDSVAAADCCCSPCFSFINFLRFSWMRARRAASCSSPLA